MCLESKLACLNAVDGQDRSTKLEDDKRMSDSETGHRRLLSCIGTFTHDGSEDKANGAKGTC